MLSNPDMAAVRTRALTVCSANAAAVDPVDQDGSLHVIVAGTRIPVNFDRDNTRLASLMFASCGIR